MNKLKITLAVLATAALTTVVSNAADTFAPSATTNAAPVLRSRTTGVQVEPTSYERLLGYTTNIDSESYAPAAGTNFVLNPAHPFWYIGTNNGVCFVRATNAAATTAWQSKVYIQKHILDRPLVIPAGWNWPTNATLNAGTGTNTTSAVSTLASNVSYVVTFLTVGTNVDIESVNKFGR